MKVRCNEARELRQGGVGVSPIGQIAQDLIESPIFFNDLDHVLDVVLQEFHGCGLLFAQVQVEAVVPRNDIR